MIKVINMFTKMKVFQQRAAEIPQQFPVAATGVEALRCLEASEAGARCGEFQRSSVEVWMRRR
jgi:hypothetical protein